MIFLPLPHLIFLLTVLATGLPARTWVVPAVGLPVYLAGLAVAWRSRSGGVGRRAEAWLALAGVPLALAIVLAGGEHFTLSLQYWLATVLTVRAWRRMERRDYAFCFLISAALYAHIGRVYEDVHFLFLTLGLAAFTPAALFQFLASYGGFGAIAASTPRHARSKLTLGRFWYFAALSSAWLALTAVLFLCLPRGSDEGMLNDLLADKQTTGFSENVSLGTFDELTEQRDIVMTVQTDVPAYWRGTVLDFYEGGVWHQTAGYQFRKPGETSGYRPDEPSVRRRFQIFDIRRTNFDLLSAGNIVGAAQAVPKWRMWINDLYASLAVVASEVTDFRGSYEVGCQDAEFIGLPELSDRDWPVPTDLGSRILEKDLFLRLPSDASPELRNLAAEITRNESSIEARAVAVRNYLSANYTYSLTDLASGSRPALDYFLFESRKGHCEYFATAMAILLRCTGVQTRVVRGFLPGALVDDRYVVRLSDAHLWTEVFFPGKGWKAFDATPEAVTSVRRAAGLTFLEKVQLEWQTRVLQYGGTSQATLAVSVKSALASALTRLRRAPGAGIAVFPAVAAVLIVLLLGRRIRLRLHGLLHLLFGAFQHDPRLGPVPGYFRKYLRHLARRGYERRPGTTPNDLLVRLEHDGAPVINDARVLTGQFYRMRFGGEDLSRNDTQALRLALERVRKWAQ